MALYEVGKEHYRLIHNTNTFEYLGILAKRDVQAISDKEAVVTYVFAKENMSGRHTVSINYVRDTGKEIYPKIIYTAEEKVAYEKAHQDPFNLNPHEFEKPKTPFSDSLDSIAYILEQIEKPFAPYPLKYSLDDAVLDAYKYAFQFGYSGRIQGVRPQPQPPKNRIPDRVVFNQDKGKVTVLISKHLDGVAPYWAYTSKVHVESGDKFDAEFGFLLSYYKYLIRRFDLKVQKEMIERIFKILKERRYVYLLGVVENEVLKINGVGSYKDWEDIYLAITDPSNAKNVYDYTWDHLEWKEMLRVHELETKREEQKAIRKEIKKHEQEIEKLKKKGV